MEQAFHGILNEVYKIVTTREVYNDSSDGRNAPGRVQSHPGAGHSTRRNAAEKELLLKENPARTASVASFRSRFFYTKNSAKKFLFHNKKASPKKKYGGEKTQEDRLLFCTLACSQILLAFIPPPTKEAAISSCFTSKKEKKFYATNASSFYDRPVFLWWICLLFSFLGFPFSQCSVRDGCLEVFSQGEIFFFFRIN